MQLIVSSVWLLLVATLWLCCHFTKNFKINPKLWLSTIFHVIPWAWNWYPTCFFQHFSTLYLFLIQIFSAHPQYATNFLFCFSKSWKRPWAWINTLNLFFKSKTDRFKLSDRHEMNQSDQLKRGIGRLSMRGRGGAFTVTVRTPTAETYPVSRCQGPYIPSKITTDTS